PCAPRPDRRGGRGGRRGRGGLGDAGAPGVPRAVLRERLEDDAALGGVGAMRIGIQGSGQLPRELPDPARYRAVAELAEELGYDSIWAGEHLSFHNPILDLGVALATFAAVTRRI